MKIKTPVIVLSVIFASALLAVGQQAVDDSTPQPESQDDIAERMGILYVDLTTFKVVGPRKDYPQDEGINSPEECLKRKLGAMQILDHEQYAKLFPLTPEQKAGIDESIFEFEHNAEYTALKRWRMSPKELEEEAAMLEALGEAISHPSPEPQGPPP